MTPQQEAQVILLDALQKVCALTGATKVTVTYKRYDLGPSGTGIERSMDHQYFYNKQKAKLPRYP